MTEGHCLSQGSHPWGLTFDDFLLLEILVITPCPRLFGPLGVDNSAAWLASGYCANPYGSHTPTFVSSPLVSKPFSNHPVVRVPSV